VTVHFVVDTGSGAHVVVDTASYVSDASGLVSFSGRIPMRAGSYRITATSPTIAGVSLPLIVVIKPAAATQIGFVTPTSTPHVSAQAGAAIPVGVVLFDQFGNYATTTAATSITVSLTPPNGVSGVTFSGTKTVSTSSGV